MQNVVFDPMLERVDKVNEDIVLISRKDGVLFGTDSFLLSAFARSCKNGTAVELGAGTGIVSMLLAQKKKYKTIFAVEIRESYSKLAERNVELNGLSGSVTVLNKDARDVTAGDVGATVDSVIMNPPYMIPGHGKENESGEMNAARRELYGNIYDFCEAAGRILRFGGTLSVVYRPERLSDIVDSMRRSRIEPKRIVPVHPFPDAPPSLILIEGKSGASPSVQWSRPLIICESRESKRYTADAETVYSSFTFDHLFK